jgi:hypothetical protein
MLKICNRNDTNVCRISYKNTDVSSSCSALLQSNSQLSAKFMTAFALCQTLDLTPLPLSREASKYGLPEKCRIGQTSQGEFSRVKHNTIAVLKYFKAAEYFSQSKNLHQSPNKHPMPQRICRSRTITTLCHTLDSSQNL